MLHPAIEESEMLAARDAVARFRPQGLEIPLWRMIEHAALGAQTDPQVFQKPAEIYKAWQSSVGLVLESKILEMKGKNEPEDVERAVPIMLDAYASLRDRLGSETLPTRDRMSQLVPQLLEAVEDNVRHHDRHAGETIGRMRARAEGMPSRQPGQSMADYFGSLPASRNRSHSH